MIASKRKALEATHEQIVKYADKHRSELHLYKVGNLVLLSGCTIKTKRPSQKLKPSSIDFSR